MLQDDKPCAGGCVRANGAPLRHLLPAVRMVPDRSAWCTCMPRSARSLWRSRSSDRRGAGSDPQRRGDRGSRACRAVARSAEAPGSRACRAVARSAEAGTLRARSRIVLLCRTYGKTRVFRRIRANRPPRHPPARRRGLWRPDPAGNRAADRPGADGRGALPDAGSTPGQRLRLVRLQRSNAGARRAIQALLHCQTGRSANPARQPRGAHRHVGRPRAAGAAWRLVTRSGFDWCCASRLAGRRMRSSATCWRNTSLPAAAHPGSSARSSASSADDALP